MQAVQAFLASGAAALLVLLLVVAEGGLLYQRWRRGAGASPGRWLSQLLAGAALVGTLYLAQIGAHPFALGTVLMIAGAAHLGGYRQRWANPDSGK